jgi:hypothetical protein
MERPGRLGPLSRLAIFLLVGALALVLGLLGVAKKLPRAKPARKAGASAAAATSKKPAQPVVQGPTGEELRRSIDAALAVLRDPNNPNKAQALAALRAALAGADPKVAIAAIREFLKTSQDAKTGMRFKVGEGGILTESPSFRTFLMDQLGSLSQEAQTADAAEVARDTLNAMTSADEWAVAMRNLAWADPAGSKPYLAEKVREMLNNAAWQQNPSGGYLEAFDVAAYAGDASLTPDLAHLAATPSPLRQAAQVALERLSATAPAAMSAYLNDNPAVLSDLPMLRADYMGNVDLSDPAQDAEAQAYLSRTDVSDAEKQKFLGRLAMPAAFVSYTLLTPPEPTTPLVQHEAVVNSAAASWLASGSYPALTSQLQTLIQRTAAAAAGGS